MVPAARILLVDDETTVLSLLGRYLEREGFQVTKAASAEEAYALFSADSQRFQLVVTDLSLPGMNGEELIGKLRALNPQIPAVISSGYAYEPHTPGVVFLQKPFLPKALGTQIQALLS